MVRPACGSAIKDRYLGTRACFRGRRRVGGEPLTLLLLRQVVWSRWFNALGHWQLYTQLPWLWREDSGDSDCARDDRWGGGSAPQIYLRRWGLHLPLLLLVLLVGPGIHDQHLQPPAGRRGKRVKAACGETGEEADLRRTSGPQSRRGAAPRQCLTGGAISPRLRGLKVKEGSTAASVPGQLTVGS